VKKVKLTQGKVALVDDEDFERVNRFKWCALKHRARWYAGRRDGNRTALMHRVIFGSLETHQQVDHINGDGLDNQRSNLRVCTSAQNRANSVMYRTNKSGYRGVSRHPSGLGWRACIKCNNKTRNLGRFEIPEQAAKRYDEEARRCFGEFARLNFPQKGERHA
jgi:hypothetical protein